MAQAPVRSASRPPPVGGWDTRSALTDMPRENAIKLDNWWPSTDRVELRKGRTEHATGLGASVESLMEYVGVNGVAKAFGAAGANIYDVTASGAVGAAEVGSLTNARFQYTNFGTAGGQFLLLVNGSDTMLTFDGSSWSTGGMTGPTVANLIWINQHQRRLWFGEKNSLSAWYLAANAITGLAVEFPLHGIVKRGGYIMAMGTWTRDSGSGTDDVAVFLTSEGEAVVYAGTDPAAAATWSLIGVFQIGKPIGRRCMVKFGGDLVMVTEDGFVAAASILMTERARAEDVAISRHINKAVNDAVRSYGSNYGWQPILYPFGQMLLFNIPTKADGSEAVQHAFNVVATRVDEESGRPYSPAARFTDTPAICWVHAANNIYFGADDGKTYRFDNGTSDAGANINADAVGAFDYFGSPARNKAFKRVEPIFQSVDDPVPAVDANVDFEILAPTAVGAASASSYALWDTAVWDTGIWGGAATTWRGWRPVRGEGRAASARVRINTNVAQPAWVSTNWLYTPGGPL